MFSVKHCSLTVPINMHSLARAISMCDGISKATRIPAYLLRGTSVIYDSAAPKPVVVRYV